MKKRKLGRTSAHRRALFRSLATSVFLNDRIETTEAKAKAVKPIIDKLVTLGKKGDLAARRRAAAYLMKPEAVRRLFSEVAPRYQERNGGYCRVIKAGFRRGDGASVAILELV
ncbi:MAG: 50S ribosomal protein L17 [Limnochordia bacterium]|jgi:large subunit ribosomal protein L17